MASPTSSVSSLSSWSSSLVSECRMLSRTAAKVGMTMSSTTAVFQAISRKRSERNIALTCSNRIAAPPHRLDRRVLEKLLKFVAQPVDVDLNHVGGAFPVGLPKVLAEHAPRHHLPGVAHEQLQ